MEFIVRLRCGGKLEYLHLEPKMAAYACCTEFGFGSCASLVLPEKGVSDLNCQVIFVPIIPYMHSVHDLGLCIEGGGGGCY